MFESAHPFFLYTFWLAWGLAMAWARHRYVRELLALEPAVFAFMNSKTVKRLEFLAHAGALGLGCGGFILLFGWSHFISDWNHYMAVGFMAYVLISFGSKYAHREWALDDRVEALKAGREF